MTKSNSESIKIAKPLTVNEDPDIHVNDIANCEGNFACVHAERLAKLQCPAERNDSMCIQNAKGKGQKECDVDLGEAAYDSTSLPRHSQKTSK